MTEEQAKELTKPYRASMREITKGETEMLCEPDVIKLLVRDSMTEERAKELVGPHVYIASGQVGDGLSTKEPVLVVRDAILLLMEHGKEDIEWRKLLWFRHGCDISALYGDDGELQCGACGIDFKRMSAQEIDDAWTNRGGYGTKALKDFLNYVKKMTPKEYEHLHDAMFPKKGGISLEEIQSYCCHNCNPNLVGRIMILCRTCGNKRCPKATDHHLECTNSNEPGQPGSSYQL